MCCDAWSRSTWLTGSLATWRLPSPPTRRQPPSRNAFPTWRLFLLRKSESGRSKTYLWGLCILGLIFNLVLCPRETFLVTAVPLNIFSLDRPRTMWWFKIKLFTWWYFWLYFDVQVAELIIGVSILELEFESFCSLWGSALDPKTHVENPGVNTTSGCLDNPGRVSTGKLQPP